MAGTVAANGETLLVPMHLDALVINKKITARDAYNRWQLHYKRMNRFENPMDPPFDNQRPKVEKGVHLHWALPDGLTHGVENEEGEIEFPYVPNRWLVVRIQPGASPDGTSSVKAWVVLSDKYGPDGSGCTSPFIDPDPQKSRPGSVKPTLLGSSMTLQDWNRMMDKGDVTPVVPFLRAIGPGNVTFAAFAPGVENVFGFHDKVSDVGVTKLTYLVVGWYSHPESMDPLWKLPADAWQCDFLFNMSSRFRSEFDGGKLTVLDQVFKDHGFDLGDTPQVSEGRQDGEWLITAGPRIYTARLEEEDINIYDCEVAVAGGLNWAVRLQGASPPTRTLVHGMVYSVEWDPRARLPEAPARPKDIREQVRVAVGNTAVDALAAMMRKQARGAGGVLAEDGLLEAFQYNLLATLDQAGGKALLDQRIRQASFGSEPGGIRWSIVTKERADTQAVEKPPRLTRNQPKWLAELNQKQRRLDTQRRLLASMQWELYALWWKSKRIKHVPDLGSNGHKEALRHAKAQLLGQVIDQQETVADLETEVPIASGPQSAQSIAEYAKGHLYPEQELKPLPMPRFWHPNDPVILISGLGRSEKHGYDATLLCRLLSQTIDGITVPHQGESISLTADTLESAIPLLSSKHLPPSTTQLLTEAFFLDPGNAEIMAKASPQLRADGNAVSGAIADIKPVVPEGTNMIGRYGALEWEQPWNPLYLDWQVGFYYTFKDRWKDWQFNGTDYVWTGPEALEICRGPISYSGRTFLTPQASVAFVDRLREYFDSHPGIVPPDAEKLLEEISKWDLLSQTMSGFTYQLAMRDTEYNLPPEESIAPHIGPHYDSFPFLNHVPDVDASTSSVAPFFFPLRAGFIAFEKLRIIDSFGRILDLMQARGSSSGNEGFQPIRGRGFGPGHTHEQFIELPPRVVQGSRLSFRYVSAQDDFYESGLLAGSSPVCGWLLPNHLDNSISVYDAAGNLLGELLLLLKSEDETIVNWQPAPGGPDLSPAGSSRQRVQISNKHLRNMIEALIGRKDNITAFSNLLRVIDRTLWTTDPLGERSDQNLSVLIGRPLALVRANLQLELNGRPFYNQAWHETFREGTPDLKENSGGLLDLEFRIRLGSRDLPNNGLIGYFQRADYTRFHAVHLPKEFAPAEPRFIRQIGADDDYVRLMFKVPSAASDAARIDPVRSIHLTMLVDPRGVVQATSGLLPTKTVELPKRYVSEPLERMAVTFRVGPLLLEPQAVRIPQPTEQLGDWSWIQATGTKRGQWATVPTEKADARARLTTTPLVIREGWLKFLPEQMDE